MLLFLVLLNVIIFADVCVWISLLSFLFWFFFNFSKVLRPFLRWVFSLLSGLFVCYSVLFKFSCFFFFFFELYFFYLVFVSLLLFLLFFGTNSYFFFLWHSFYACPVLLYLFCLSCYSLSLFNCFFLFLLLLVCYFICFPFILFPVMFFFLFFVYFR